MQARPRKDYTHNIEWTNTTSNAHRYLGKPLGIFNQNPLPPTSCCDSWWNWSSYPWRYFWYEHFSSDGYSVTSTGILFDAECDVTSTGILFDAECDAECDAELSYDKWVIDWGHHKLDICCFFAFFDFARSCQTVGIILKSDFGILTLTTFCPCPYTLD